MDSTARLHSVAQTVAKKIDGQDRTKNAKARRDGQPRCGTQPRTGCIQKIAPSRHRWLNPKAEERQSGFEHDGTSDGERRGNRDGTNGIRENMSEHHARSSRAERARCLDEL